MNAKERLQNTWSRNRVVYTNIIFSTMPLRDCGDSSLSKTFIISGSVSSIVKHDCGTAVVVFLK